MQKSELLQNTVHNTLQHKIYLLRTPVSFFRMLEDTDDNSTANWKLKYGNTINHANE